jgi:hypothetical protein
MVLAHVGPVPVEELLAGGPAILLAVWLAVRPGRWRRRR